MSTTAALVVGCLLGSAAALPMTPGPRTPQAQPSVPHSFKAEVSVDGTWASQNMRQFGAGYIIVDGSAGAKGKTRNHLAISTVTSTVQIETTTDILSDYDTGNSFTYTCQNATGSMTCSCSETQVTGSVLDQFNFSGWKYLGDATVGIDRCTQWEAAGTIYSVTKAAPTVLRQIQTNMTNEYELAEYLTDTIVGPAPASTWIVPTQWGCTKATADSAPLQSRGKGGHVLMMQAAGEAAKDQLAKRFDIAVSVNIGPEPSGYTGVSDCRASSSSNSFMGTDCSHVSWAFTLPHNFTMSHRISASDDWTWTPIVESESSRCTVSQVGATQMFIVECYNQDVSGGKYMMSILMLPHAPLVSSVASEKEGMNPP